MPQIRMGSWKVTPANKIYAHELIRTGDFRKALKKAYPDTSLKNATARRYSIHRKPGFREYFENLMIQAGLPTQVVEGLREQLGATKPHINAQGEDTEISDNEARHKAQKLILDAVGITGGRTIVQQSETGKTIDLDPEDWEEEPDEVLEFLKTHGKYPHHLQKAKLLSEEEDA